VVGTHPSLAVKVSLVCAEATDSPESTAVMARRKRKRGRFIAYLERKRADAAYLTSDTPFLRFNGAARSL
jgi:hypothetical protein